MNRDKILKFIWPFVKLGEKGALPEMRIEKEQRKMTELYRICHEGGQGEIVEKKSRFIANVRPVKTEEQAISFIEEMRRTYWDARHNCYAYVCGDRNQIMKCSDDGEPSQTAGRPMLDVLLGQNLHDVCVVVTRYFGGTLLGTGGLVRAYSQAVKEGLKASSILTRKQGRKLTAETDYSAVGKFQYLAAQNNFPILDSQYTDRVKFVLLLPEEKANQAVDLFTEATGGTAVLSLSDPVFYGEEEGKLVFL